MLRILLAAACLAATPVCADVCRWTDSDGRTHYSSSPPPGVACARTLKAPAPTAAARAKSAQDLEIEFQQRRGERLQAEQRAEAERRKAEQRAEQCAQARGRLAWIEGGGRMVRIDANGERRFLDDADVGRETAAARARVEHACRP